MYFNINKISACYGIWLLTGNCVYDYYFCVKEKIT